MESLTQALVESSIRDLIAAEKTNLGIEVSVPVLYPDGDTVIVIVEETARGVRVHDAGFAAMRLSQAGIRISHGVTQQMKLSAARFRCSFSHGRISAETDIAGVGRVVCLVANAARSIADYALEIKTQTEAHFRQIVSDALREIAGKRLRENEEMQGKSGLKYRLPAIILDRSEAKPTNFISAIASRQTVPKSFSMLYDLRDLHQTVENVAIYDDSSDIRKEDRSLLLSVGSVFSFAETPLRFREIMRSPHGHGHS